MLVAALGLAGCHHADIVGTLGCSTSKECEPPDTICSADGRCVTGCLKNPSLCVGGSTCNAKTGECLGGAIGSACASDNDCDPPDVVCRTSDGTCQPGCTVSPVCASNDVCNPSSGHCCTPGAVGCPAQMPPAISCNSDAECPGAPANICSAGLCVAGCGAGGLCAAGLVCESTTGHCQSPNPSCARDSDCDAGSYCTQAGACAVLAFGGTQDCAAGSASVLYACASATTPADFGSCAGAAGPSGCPYCIDESCMHPGLCASDADCHAGDKCTNGLCMVQSPQCPVIVEIADVFKGVYAAGKEVCVRGVVQLTRSGADGELEIKLDTSPYLYVDVEPMYNAAGVTLPQVKQTVTVHGTVRWDAGHQDRELLPVDWISTN